MGDIHKLELDFGDWHRCMMSWHSLANLDKYIVLKWIFAMLDLYPNRTGPTPVQNPLWSRILCNSGPFSVGAKLEGYVISHIEHGP